MRRASTTPFLDTPQPSVPRHRGGELFVRGPIPWAWLKTAARLPGRALHVGIVLWLESGLRTSAVVALSQQRLRDLGIDRYASYRGLVRLEQAELVEVRRHPGRLSDVTLRLPTSAPARSSTIERSEDTAAANRGSDVDVNAND